MSFPYSAVPGRVRASRLLVALLSLAAAACVLALAVPGLAHAANQSIDDGNEYVTVSGHPTYASDVQNVSFGYDGGTDTLSYSSTFFSTEDHNAPVPTAIPTAAILLDTNFDGVADYLIRTRRNGADQSRTELRPLPAYDATGDCHPVTSALATIATANTNYDHEATGLQASMTIPNARALHLDQFRWAVVAEDASGAQRDFVPDRAASTATCASGLRAVKLGDGVDYPAPFPKATFSSTPSAPLTTSLVSFDAGASTSEGTPITKFEWDLDGDGVFETDRGLQTTVTKTFPDAGAHTVRLRVSNARGSTTFTKVIDVAQDTTPTAQQCTPRTVTVGLLAVAGCFREIPRPVGPILVAAGAVKLNGLDLAPTNAGGVAPRTFSDCTSAACAEFQQEYDGGAGSLFFIDGFNKAVGTNRPYRLTAGSTDLLNGPLLLSGLDFSSTKPIIDADVTGAGKLYGFPLTGRFSLTLNPQGALVHVVVGLPSVLGGVTGETNLLVTNGGGLVLQGIKIEVGAVKIGKLDLSDLSFEYDATQNLWAGGLAVILPTPQAISIAGQVVVQDNRFKSIMGEVGNLNQSLGAGVFLQKVRFGVGVDPVTVSGGMSLSAGPEILGQEALGVDADFKFVFGNPFVLRLDGTLSVVSLDVGHAYVEYNSVGYLAFGGSLGASFGPAFLEGKVDGWVDKTKNFNLQGSIEAGIDFGAPIGRRSIKAQAVVSSVGAAACGDIAGWFAAGVGARWGDSPRLFSGCDLSPYSATRATAAIAALAHASGAGRVAALSRQARRVSIPQGADVVVVRLTGKTASPNVKLIGPGGRAVTASRATLGGSVIVGREAKSKSTSIVLRNPTAGTWRIAPLKGSSAITRVERATGLPEPVVHGTVTGTGATRKLTYDVVPLPGQRVVFYEDGADAARVIATTTKAKGTVTFAPAPGDAGVRHLKATVEQDGLPRRTLDLGTFKNAAPGGPPAVKGLELRRSGGKVTATWKASKGASRYEVRIKAGDGRTLVRRLPSKTRKVVVSVKARDAVRVTVTPVSAKGVSGKATTKRLGAKARAAMAPGSAANPYGRELGGSRA